MNEKNGTKKTLTLKELGIPPVKQQIEDYYRKLPPLGPSKKRETDRESILAHVKNLIEGYKLEMEIRKWLEEGD